MTTTIVPLMICLILLLAVTVQSEASSSFSSATSSSSPSAAASSPLLFQSRTLEQQSTPTVSLDMTRMDDNNSNDKKENNYALYSLPPFTITLSSSYTSTAGLPSDPQERGSLLASTLHLPLQMITAEFLMESFRIEIAKQSPSSNGIVHKTSINTNPTTSSSSMTITGYNNNTTGSGSEESLSLQSILDNLMTLDLQVAVRWVDPSTTTTTSQGQDGGRRQLRRQLSVEKEGGELRQQPYSYLKFEADFFTTAAFLEPFTKRSLNNPGNSVPNYYYTRPPSNEEVANLMGGWMKTAFVNEKEYYFGLLVNSEVSVLKHLEDLTIVTNSHAVFDPYAMGTLGSTGAGNHHEQQQGSSSPDSNNNAEQQAASNNNVASLNNNNSGYGSNNNATSSWSPTEKLFFTLLVMVSVLSIAGLLLAIKQFSVRRAEKLDRRMDLEGSLSARRVDEFSDHVAANSCIGGRHADEIMDIINASDRYLATHRPDLLEAMQQTTQQDKNKNNIVAVAANNDSTDRRPVERRYVTATNPFSYLYGASYFHSDRQAVEEDRKARREDPMAGVELQHESVPDDEDLDLVDVDTSRSDGSYKDQSVSGFMQKWFQHLVGTRTCMTTGVVHDDDDMDELIIEEANGGGGGSSGIMACDEDPTQYQFAYQDFPRQDGTPCLIYEETLNEEEEEQYLRNSRRDSLHSTNSYGIHEPLTDDEFRRALSQRDLMDFQSSNSSNNSFDLRHNNSNNTSFDQTAEETEEEDDDDDQSNAINTSIRSDTSSSSNVASDSGESDPSQFTDKLEKLVAMRHRHYQKQQIVEKHREQRRQERARQRAEEKQKQQEEMQERDRRLRRHSLELDIQELEAAAVASRASSNNHGTASSASAKVVTPTDGISGHQQQGLWGDQQGELRKLQKPNLHRRTSSEADMGLATTAAVAVGIQKNRSMDLDEGRVFDHSALISSSNSLSNRSLPVPSTCNPRLVQSAQKHRPGNISRISPSCEGIFRPSLDKSSPVLSSSSPPIANGTGLPPATMQQKIETVDLPVVSPASSMTDTGSTTTPNSSADSSHNGTIRATPPLMMGSGSIRDGSSARRKKRDNDNVTGSTSSASLALAKGFKSRRSMSFGDMEEKKMEEDTATAPGFNHLDGNNNSHGKQQPLPPPHRQTPRRSNSSSRADVMVHGIYAQFV